MCVCTGWWKIRNCGNEWDDSWWWRMQNPPASPVLRLLKLTDCNISPKCFCLSKKLCDVTSHTTILILDHRQNVISYILHKGPGCQVLMHWCSVQQILCSSPAQLSLLWQSQNFANGMCIRAAPLFTLQSKLWIPPLNHILCQKKWNQDCIEMHKW